MYRFLILAGAVASAAAFMESSRNFAEANCTDNEFVCGNLQCIPLAKQCDHKADCADSTDEKDCEMYHCEPPNFFRCKNSRCISSAFVCNEEDDCDDYSDEENCEEFKKILQSNSTCEAGQWQCTDRLCIPEEWVCNGQSDCLDGSDETLGCSTNITCDGFKCRNGHCIPSEWSCDGQNDCRDNSDEENCESQMDPEECTLDNQRFLCGDGKTCLDLKDVCDGKEQCPDRTDEGPSCNKTCDGHSCSHYCVRLPTGPRCVCPQGYRTIDDKHCEDVNECETYGICDQKCKNTAGSYQCSCDEHYTLQSDKKTCLVQGGEAIMFFSSKKEIRAFIMKEDLYFSVVKDLNQVVGVDFDGESVYWTDIFAEHESIMKSSHDGTNQEALVTSGLGAPEDLHVDHITGNIYFTDAERQHIGVCTNDGAYCTILINKDIDKPRGIALHPEEGEMYWTDWGHKPQIARASMDGTEDHSFVSSNIHWPNGLAIDYPNRRLYWTDAKILTLESIKLDGTDRRVILEGVVRHPYAIAVFENRLYWSDWVTHSIQSCDKFTGKNQETIIKEKKGHIYGISIYHPNLRKKAESNPCSSALCSDICLLNGPAGYTCACPPDKILGVDRHVCRDVGKNQKLIVGADGLLIQVEYQILGKHGMTFLPTTAKKMGALAYNSVENVLYVSDLEIRKIISLDLHTWVSKPLEISDLGQVVAMDYDYLGNNLYWCDSEKSTVEVLNFNTKSKKVLIHDMYGETPESIALVPEEGVMFVALQKFNRKERHIDRFSMDGSTRTHSIEQGLPGPVNLFYDGDLHRIFLSDGGTGKIESTSVDGDDRHGFRSLRTSPIGVTSLKSEIFWVNQRSRTMFWADKYNAGDDYTKRLVLDIPDDPNNMHIISITPRRIGLSPCQHRNGNCSHLCLHSQKSVLCACPVGMRLDEDNQTCTRDVDCTSFEFFCGRSNVCISNLFRCDGTKNCPNGEDEQDCKVPHHCPLDSFQCADGECIKEEHRCDFKYDCRDKSDEHNCSHVEAQRCPPNHFQCQDGECIKQRFICDGVSDCMNHEDEANCVGIVCKDSEFRCSSGACIPKNWECDHDYDCTDMSDEHSSCPTCASQMFTCTNGKCIDKKFVCDHDNDCGDNSDELSCGAKPEATCTGEEFPCASHTDICLPLSARCNGTSECPHHEDETNCSDCHVDEFTCQNRKCIPTQWICDRTDDCGDNSDEASSLCQHSPSEAHKFQTFCTDFQCKNGDCLDFSLVCNGQPDCYDGSDEDGVCKTSCDTINNPCSHVCMKTPTGPICKCQKGYHLQGDGHSCEDIDECNQHPPVCSQICRNVLGAHSCDCYEGFALKADRISCKAEGKAMSMVFVTDNQIRELSQVDNSLRLIHDSKDTPRITGLDVSVKTGEIYFTVEQSGTILMVTRNSSRPSYIEIAGQPHKLSLDWVTNNLYYVDNEAKSKSISICNFDDKACGKLIPLDSHRQVSAIAVDASNRFLFYSLVSWWLFNAPSYVVYKTNLDGTGSHELIKTRSGYVTGLAFDPYKKELFYVDHHQGQLGKIDYDGTMNTILASNLSRPAGLNFFENQLFFLTQGGLMGKCRLYSPTACDSFSLNSHSTDLFAIVQESRQPEFAENPCRNHTCPYLCLPTKLHHKCLCEDGRLVASGEECDGGNAREAGPSKTILAIHHYKHSYSSNSNIGPTVAAIMISICLVTFAVVLFYLIKRKSSGTFNISMRFHNPGYGLHTDEVEKSILQPGQHEYSNPAGSFEAETESDRRENLLVDV